ncbi:MAG TPA: adenylate/guanylate cyclase domain-containing protein [Solirubrobacteraceae bacterium]
MDVPRTRYARNGRVHLAYQVVGDHPRDLLFITSWIAEIEHLWAEPRVATGLRRIASFSRLILFDRRGSGMSDRLPFAPLEEQMDDVRAVLSAAGAQRVTVFAETEGTALACLFAATYPARVEALVLYSPIARFLTDEDYPWGFDAEQRAEWVEGMYWHWGEGAVAEVMAPSLAGDREFVEWYGRLERLAVSPGAVRPTQHTIGQQDVRAVLPLIRVPTLVVVRRDNQAVDPRHCRYVAEHIPGARLVEVPGRDQLLPAGNMEEVLAPIEEFLGFDRPAVTAERVLATVLFTDIVGSTEQAARLGDRDWSRALDAHRALVRAQLSRHGGREVKTLGDGFLVDFDGPARAIRCALAVAEGSAAAGLLVRAGVHTGEVERDGADLNGIAVHIAARVMGEAGPNEVLVSRTVADLVAGSGLTLTSRGARALKGVPGEWELYAAAA